MEDKAALDEIDRKIQIVENNLQELIEQAAAFSGAADEERAAERIADQQAKLDALLKEREACSDSEIPSRHERLNSARCARNPDGRSAVPHLHLWLAASRCPLWVADLERIISANVRFRNVSRSITPARANSTSFRTLSLSS